METTEFIVGAIYENPKAYGTDRFQCIGKGILRRIAPNLFLTIKNPVLKDWVMTKNDFHEGRTEK